MCRHVATTSGAPVSRAHHKPATRNRLTFGALLTMTVIGVALSLLVVSPFLSALTWAFALAVVAHPLHEWIHRRIASPNLAAGISVVLVTLILFLPAAFVVWRVGEQASEGFDQIRQQLEGGTLRSQAARVPFGGRFYDALIGQGGKQNGEGTLAASVPQQAGAWLQAAIGAAVQGLVALFVLFFLFRDRAQVLGTVRSYLPMSDREVDYFLARIRNMTHATIYGNGLTSLLQGTLGGIMFAVLGLEGALLWGVAMALLSLIPSAGAFVIWLPAAVVLAFQDEWLKAAILAGWGVLVVGTIDNVLYPVLVGKEMKLHALAVFLSLVGGLFVFGAPGLVLGPVVAAATVALLDILRARTTRRRSAVEPR